MPTQALPEILQQVSIGSVRLPGILAYPEPASGLIAFAHGSGSSRLSPRNTRVARALNHHGFATLQFDLLSEQEAQDRSNVFNIALLADRVMMAVQWARAHAKTGALKFGLFGASTGAAAALKAAAFSPDQISAVVSRGGRPDLAQSVLPLVQAPTLLIVGGADTGVIELNEQALGELRCKKDLHIVPGATHLFEEPGALDQVIQAAGSWFNRHLREHPT